MKIIEPKEHKNIYILKKVNRVLRNLWNTIKQINIYIVRVSEEEKIEKMVEKTFDEIMSENFSNLKGMDVNIQVKGTLNKIKSKTVSCSRIQYNQIFKRQKKNFESSKTDSSHTNDLQ